MNLWAYILDKLCVLICVYAITSLLVFIFPVQRIPKVLRTKSKNPHLPVWIGAHRGGAREALENTLPAFRRCKTLGIEMVEMDIHETKDGVPVVCHDGNLERLCGQDVSIKDLRYAELPAHQDRIRLHFADGYYEVKDSDERRIPKLEEVMAEMDDMTMNIELKDNSEALKTNVLKMIRAHKRESITIWGHMNAQHHDRMKEMAPDIATWICESTGKKSILAYVTGWLPFFYINTDTF
jgi:glycerophosphoryl diester phosphodiesterase